MSPIILALLAFVCIGALGFAFVPALLGSGRADKRRKALQGDYQVARANMDVERTRDNRRKTVQEALNAQAEEAQKRRKKVTLQTRIFQAGMDTKKSVFIRNSVIFSVVLLAVLIVVRVPWYFAAFFSVAFSYLGGLWFLSFKRKRYQARYLEELPNAIEAIVRGIKAGMPLNDSIRVVARDIKEPVRSEFGRVLEQQSIGKSTMEAVQVLYDRVPLSEVNFFVVVITVQQQAGGNLSEALGNLSRVLRDRKKMKGKMKAMAAEAKASAAIIGALPFIVGSLVSVASPGYLWPLLSTNLGHLWIGVGAVLFSMGIFVMSRMIQFDY